MAEKILYAAYGSNREPEVMAEVTGNEDLHGIMAYLKNTQLCVRALEDLPDQPVEGLPPEMTARRLLEQAWGPNFLIFSGRYHKDSNVLGRVYELTPEEFEMVEEWEMVKFGLHQKMTVDILPKVTPKRRIGKVAVTHGLVILPGDPVPTIQRITSGLTYYSYLNDEELTLSQARHTREAALARKNPHN